MKFVSYVEKQKIKHIKDVYGKELKMHEDIINFEIYKKQI